MHGDELTHPDITSFVDPLFACGGKRVKKAFLNLMILLTVINFAIDRINYNLI
jgi:hypothetical protein